MSTYTDYEWSEYDWNNVEADNPIVIIRTGLEMVGQSTYTHQQTGVSILSAKFLYNRKENSYVSNKEGWDYKTGKCLTMHYDNLDLMVRVYNQS